MKNQPRFSISTHLFSEYSSQQKQNNSVKFISFSDKNMGNRSIINQNSSILKTKQFVERVVQWRKNTELHIINICHSQYSTIITSSKSIQLPKHYQTQKIVRRMSELKDLSIDESMYVLSSLLQGYENIKKFFGFISFQLRFCGVNADGKVKAWINSESQKNEAEGQPIKYESEGVTKIIQEVKKISATQFSEFYTYYLRNARKKLCDFKHTITLIKSYCSCMKIKIPSRLPDTRKERKQSIFENIKSPSSLNQSLSFRQSLNSIEQEKDKQFVCLALKKNWTKVEKTHLGKGSVLNKNFSQKNLNSPGKKHLICQPIQEEKYSMKKQEGGRKEKKQKINNNQSSIIQNKKSTYTSNIIKKSEISTNYNTQIYSNSKSSKMRDEGLDWAFTTFNKVNNFPTYQSHCDIKQKLKEKSSNYLFENVREVDCNSESSVEIERIKEKRLNREEETEEWEGRGNWKNKIENLFTGSQLKESRVIGKEPELKVNVKTEKLDRWARVIGKSILPNNNFN